MLNKALSLLYPTTCALCGKPSERGDFLCRRCKKDFEFLSCDSLCRTCLSPLFSDVLVCGRCLVRKPRYERLITCGYYTGKLKNSIHRCKFGNRPDLCVSYGLMLYRRLETLGVSGFDAVVPIPMDSDNLSERGYNQSELIAKALADNLKIPCYKDAILKRKKLRRQSELKTHLREENIRGAFELKDKESLRGKNILLVDDVVTTGATIREAAYVLSSVCRRITVCSVAKTYDILAIN